MNGRNRWIRSPGVILPVLLVAAMMAPAAAQAPAEAYRLGPEDVLEVSVWGHADLARTVTVGPDGKISLPLVGVVAAGGLTVDALTRLLTRAYDTYIVNPRVSVSVREYRKLRVSVLGQVVRPGAYALPRARACSMRWPRQADSRSGPRPVRPRSYRPAGPPLRLISSGRCAGIRPRTRPSTAGRQSSSPRMWSTSS